MAVVATAMCLVVLIAEESHMVRCAERRPAPSIARPPRAAIADATSTTTARVHCSPTLHKSQTTPQTTHQTTPQTTPQTTHQTTLQTIPQTTPPDQTPEHSPDHVPDHTSEYTSMEVVSIHVLATDITHAHTDIAAASITASALELIPLPIPTNAGW